MSSTPAYWSNRRMGRAVVSAATTDRTGATTTNIVDILTGVAAGTEITEVTVQADGDPADSLILIFLHNGTDYKLYDDWDIANPSAPSVSTSAFHEVRYYTGLFLPSASWKIAAAVTVVPTSGGIVVWASGGDLT